MFKLEGLLFAILCFISVQAHAGMLMASPPSVFFPQTPINGLSRYAYVNVTNQGSDNANGVNVVSFCGVGFYVSGFCPGVLGPWQSCQINIEFRPTQIGSYSCEIEVNSVNGPAIIDVSGQGVNN